MKSEYVGYPLSVHLETLALCNAKCTFCQYPELERVGDRMSDDTIAKVLDDLKIIPKTLPITIILYGVNEPFLDKRIFDIIKKIKLTLPNTYIQINSNGIPLNDSNLEKLKSSDITQMSISMNDYRKKEYEETMKIDYEKAIIVLEKLNKFKKNNVIPFPIGVTRAGDSSIHDIYFLKWVKDKFPYLNANCSPSFDWLGSKARFFKVPEIGCTHWFEVTIRANGDVAFCCLDGHIKYPKGNVINENVIDIYNKKESIHLRKTMTLRKNVLPCTQCRAG